VNHPECSDAVAVASNGSIYLTSWVSSTPGQNGSVSVVDPTTNIETHLLNIEIASRDMFIDSDDNISIIGSSDLVDAKSIYVLSSGDYAHPSVVKTGLGRTWCMSEGGAYTYFSNFTAINRFNSSGVIEKFLSKSVMSMSFSSKYLYYANYFGNTVGRINIQTKADETLVSSLNGPTAVRYDAVQDKLYFLEAGTVAGQFKDGTLKVINDVEVYQGDLILKDNDIYVIEGAFNINGSIVVEENATLILRNAVVNFTQTSNWQRNITLGNPLNGNPRLEVNDTTITSNYSYSINLDTNSSTNVYDSQFVGTSGAYCWIWVSGTASFHNLTVNGLSVSGSPGVSIFNSSVHDLNVYSGSLSAYNSSIYGLNSYGTGSASVDKCSLHHVYSGGTSQQHLFDSSATRIESYNNSTLWLVNSTYTQHAAYNQSVILVSWYLDVHVTDSISQDIPSANVIATYPNATVAESELTNASGLTRLTLMEKMVNATGDYSVGNYTIEATYGTYSNNASVNMNGNHQITIQLAFIVPEFSSSTILLLWTTLALLAVVLTKSHFRKHHQKENTNLTTKHS
jgi:hypothetical protein